MSTVKSKADMMPQEISFRARHSVRIGETRERSAHFVMDEFSLYDRALAEKEVALDAKGVLLSVEPERKLTTTWGDIKISH